MLQILVSLSLSQTPGSEFGNDSEMNMHGPRGLSSRVSVTSHGSGGGFSVKDGAGGSHKTRKASVAGSTTFSHSLINLTQVIFPYFLADITFVLITVLSWNMQLYHWNIKTEQYTPCVTLCLKIVGPDVDMFYIRFWNNV